MLNYVKKLNFPSLLKSIFFKKLLDLNSGRNGLMDKSDIVQLLSQASSA